MADLKVSYALGIKPEATAGRALDDLSRKSKALEKDATAAGKALSTATKASGGGPGGASGGGTGGGAGGASFTAAMGKALVAVAAIRNTISSVGDIATAINDSSLTARDRDRAIKSSIPILGLFTSEWLKFIDAVSGHTNTIKRLRVDTVMALAAVESRAALASANRSGQAIINEANVQRELGWMEHNFLRKNPAAAAALDDPQLGSLHGQRQAAGRASLEAQLRAEQAEQELRSARGQASKASATVGPLEAMLKNLGDPKTDFEKELVAGHVKNLAEAYAEQRVALQRLSEAESANTARQVELLKTKFEIGKADLAVAKERERITREERTQALKAEQERLSETERAFGGLRPEERLQALRLAQRAAGMGPDALSEWDRELLGRGGLGGAVSEAAGRSARGDPIFNEALKTIGLRTADELSAELERLKPQIEVNLKLNEALLASEITKETIKGVESIQVINKRAKENADAQRVIQMRMGQVMGGGP